MARVMANLGLGMIAIGIVMVVLWFGAETVELIGKIF